MRAGWHDGRLPGERKLASEFGVSYQTQRRAMDVLRTRGLIITRHRWGTFLAPEPGGTAHADQPAPPGTAPATR
ncbi:MAG TPA: GntR family transcriptional regulator [Streptosporangiaceae bacterium]|nr:GntR family transcriptional regulator [Streptosporangiaceae bacterium]